MPSTVWTPQTITGTHFLSEQTNSVYDSVIGSYDGGELASTDVDLLYDGHIATPPLSTTYTNAIINSTIWQ